MESISTMLSSFFFDKPPAPSSPNQHQHQHQRSPRRAISDPTGRTNSSSSLKEHATNSAARIYNSSSILHSSTSSSYYFDDDDTDQSHDNNGDDAASFYNAFILGKFFDLSTFTNRRKYESSLFFFSYRCDFPVMAPYGYTTDAGWGCMLRASQMLLCCAIRFHTVGRDWQIHDVEQKRNDAFFRQCSHYFADSPSKDSHFSIHNMVAVGLSYDKFPGEWYGPQTACLVMRELCKAFEETKFKSETPTTRPMKIVVAQEGNVYISNVEEEMCPQVDIPTADEPSIFGFGNVDNPLSISDSSKKSAKPDWHSAMLLLIPLRLGVKKIHDKYRSNLSKFFSVKSSVGFVGGTPRFALWFYGSNGSDKVFGLDPHVIQVCGRRDSNSKNNSLKFTDTFVKSMQCRSGKEAAIENLDPSLALAFYCKDRGEFEELCVELKEKGGVCSVSGGGDAPLFSLLQNAPNYDCDAGVMDDLMGGESGGESDDDDFVFV